MERRLAAILAADVVGYSHLMGVDEAGTLARMKALNGELLGPRIAARKGRVVKLMGDGLLAEFPSVVEAVLCAVDIQEEMRAREPEQPDDRRLRLRIGINLGDVMIEGDDVFGDGVNVAARLEGLAEPGGLCISGTVHEHVAAKLDLAFEDLGEQQVKNIARPVRVYRLAFDAVQEAGAPADGEEALPLPDRPSIAVLPFSNMSGDAEQDYFTDGITEDIITELSRFSELFVIARNSCFAYKGQAVDIRRVARELGVRYLLEGSVRRGGQRLRITAQLLDREGGHVWGEKYDRDLADMFDLQDEITRNVVGSMAPQIELAEVERGRKLSGTDLTAYELAMKGQALSYDAARVADPALLEQADEALDAALALDPRNTHALWARCLAYMYRHMYRWGDDPDGALAAFSEMADRLIYIDGTNAKSYMVRALAQLYQRRYDAALSDHHRALDLNPNLASNLFAMSWTEAIAGLPEEARAHAQLALRLSPRETDIWLGEGYGALALASFSEGDDAETLKWAHLANQLQPVVQALMVASHAYLGDLEAAKSHAEALRAFSPDFLDAVLADELEVCKLPEHNDRLVQGLLLAEM